MSLPIPYGLDPDETWEVDFVEAAAQRTIEAITRNIAGLKEDAEQQRDEAKRAAVLAAVASAEEAKAKLEADLAGYTRGTGPVFIVGPMPNGKSAELLGEAREIGTLSGAKDLTVRDAGWSAEVVRWTVRGHRNLRSGKSGRELQFHSEDAAFAGETRKVVARKTLEVYGRFLGELALVILRSQRLDEAGKNA